jgi:FAD/FMN-containing dehydrogenase
VNLMTLGSLRSSRRRLAPFDPDAFDPRDLVQALGETIEGDVRFDLGARALYATDASNFRHVPVGVVVPRTVDDVIATLACCRDRGVAVLSRGGGTSLAGQGCNAAVVIDFSVHLRSVIEIDPGRRRARVQPGCVLDDLRDAARPHGLTFGPDPVTHARCTVGGMLGNDSCGIHSVLAEFHGPGPRTHDNVQELDIVTYDGLRARVGPVTARERNALVAAGGRRGEIYDQLESFVARWGDCIRERLTNVPRRVSGYDLAALLPENGFHVARALVGSESTLVTVVEATLSLVDAVPGRALLVLGYPSIHEAADHIPAVRELRPVGCEGIDRRLLHGRGADVRLPRGDGLLLVEIGGASPTEATDRAHDAMRTLARHVRQGGAHDSIDMVLHTDPREQQLLWRAREAGLRRAARVADVGDHWPGWEDAAVPPERLGKYLRGLRALLAEHGYGCSLYGHFAQGCVHTRIDFSFRTDADIERYARFTRRAAELVVAHGGSLSGEHGDGLHRSDLLEVMYGPDLVTAFAEFKAIWDPDGRMNPGRIVDAVRAEKEPIVEQRTPALLTTIG